MNTALYITLCLLGNFACFSSSADFFQNQLFLRKKNSGIGSVSVGSVASNFLQRLSVDDACRQRVNWMEDSV